MKKKKYLLTRFGGIGDVAPVMVTADHLRRQGHHVTLGLRSDEKGMNQIDLLENTDCCDKAISMREVGPSRTRCVKFKHGMIDIKGTYDQYDEVIDFMHIVEYNDKCHSSFINSPTDEWKKHRNSNWQNWYDLHLAWANIDPTSIPNCEKNPVFTLSEEEEELAKTIRKGYSHVITLNPHASSLARTWYQAEDMIPELLKQYDNPLIFSWKPDKGHWETFSKKGMEVYQSPLKSPLRGSMVVLGASDVYVGADTGFTHIAEGMRIPNIAIYSSVPSWTRAEYYDHQISVDKGPHSFSLTLGDPARIEEGMKSLSKREKGLMNLHKKGVAIEEAARQLNSTPEGLNLELQSLQAKIKSFERIQSKALSKVSVKEVLKLIKIQIEEGVLT